MVLGKRLSNLLGQAQDYTRELKKNHPLFDNNSTYLRVTIQCLAFCHHLFVESAHLYV